MEFMKKKTMTFRQVMQKLKEAPRVSRYWVNKIPSGERNYRYWFFVIRGLINYRKWLFKRTKEIKKFRGRKR